ncbi:MAG: YhcH/YjgK/YiaL family protein [Spirochaetes bacterium]|nr:YhcH/YjgK/YiaL family protein [Spirochaetota bacterium]
MITDTIENAALYGMPGTALRRALEFVARTDLDALSAGRTDIDADIWCLVSEYDTRPAGELKWEAHRVCTDVQVVLAGTECIGYAPVSSMRTAVEYDADKDVMFLEGEGVLVPVLPGRFVVLMPQDAHMPGIARGAAGRVKKLVIKVRHRASS